MYVVDVASVMMYVVDVASVMMYVVDVASVMMYVVDVGVVLDECNMGAVILWRLLLVLLHRVSRTNQALVIDEISITM